MTIDNVLIVEDDKEISESLRDVLEIEGFNVDVAVNGKVALSLLENKPNPSLILLDLNMPVMNGLEFLHHRSLNPHLQQVPVIVLTAAGDSKRKEAESFADLVLKKPIDLDELLSAVDNIILN